MSFSKLDKLKNSFKSKKFFSKFWKLIIFFSRKDIFLKRFLPCSLFHISGFSDSIFNIFNSSLREGKSNYPP